MSKAEELAFQACELIVGVKACMMFDRIHADFAINEVLKKHGATTVQNLAKKAEDLAEEALKLKKGEP